MTRLEARGVRLDRAGRTLFDLDLEASSGESVAVVGPSGCGKTSLLAILAGLSAPTAGHVEIDGTPVRSLGGIGIVLQGYGLVSLLTASENVEVGLRVAGEDPTTVAASAARELAAVGLGEHGGHLVEDMSGGQQQRVAVARALALNPSVVVADEPTAEQDADSRGVVLSRLFEVVTGGGVLILATHDPKVAEACDRIVTL